MFFRMMLVVVSMLSFAACSDYTEELSGDYYFASEANDHQVIVRHSWRSGEPYIPCNVEAYDDDGRFIVARQRVTETCFWEDTRSASGSIGEVLFWIIDIRSDTFWGPYRKQQMFEQVRQELGVSAALD